MFFLTYLENNTDKKPKGNLSAFEVPSFAFSEEITGTEHLQCSKKLVSF